MGLKPASFELKDNAGTTEQFCATATSTEVMIPGSAGGLIDEFVMQNLDETNNLLVSIDGTKFWTIPPCGHLAWTPKGRIKQLKVKTNGSNVDYEAIINLGDC